MKTIKFSFIVPVYNVEAYLRRCLDSLVNQSYTNFEIICVNDGSTDRSLDILEGYKQEFSNFVVVDKVNQGLGEARNSGLRFVTGDYIWFVDSDDWIEINSLEVLNERLTSRRSDMILFNLKRINSEGVFRVVKTIPREFNFGILKHHLYLSELLRGDALFAAWNKVFDANLFKSSEFRFSQGFYEDISLMKFYYQTNCSIDYLDAPLYNYFINDNSIMKTFDGRILDVFKQFSIVYDALEKDKQFNGLLGAFFYKLMLDTVERLENVVDESVKIEFKKNFGLWSDKFSFFSKYCFFNREISVKRRVKICLKLFLPFKVGLL